MHEARIDVGRCVAIELAKSLEVRRRREPVHGTARVWMMLFEIGEHIDESGAYRSR